MKVSGSYTMNAPREAVWQRLLDPDSLAGCIPGVEKLDKTGENEYDMSMTVGIGPIRGTFDGKVRLSEINEPNDYQMYVEGSGRPGFVKGTGAVRLSDADEGATTVDYEGDIEVGGRAGAVGQRMLPSMSKRMIDGFFKCIEQQIANEQP